MTDHESNAEPEEYKRGAGGQFAKGTKGGPGGSKLASRMSHLRLLVVNAVTDTDMDEIVRALIDKAKDGDVQAAREILDRCTGKPEALDLAAKLEELEVALARVEDARL